MCPLAHRDEVHKMMANSFEAKHVWQGWSMCYGSLGQDECHEKLGRSNFIDGSCQEYMTTRK